MSLPFKYDGSGKDVPTILAANLNGRVPIIVQITSSAKASGAIVQPDPYCITYVQPQPTPTSQDNSIFVDGSLNTQMLLQPWFLDTDTISGLFVFNPTTGTLETLDQRFAFGNVPIQQINQSPNIPNNGFPIGVVPYYTTGTTTPNHAVLPTFYLTVPPNTGPVSFTKAPAASDAILEQGLAFFDTETKTTYYLAT